MYKQDMWHKIKTIFQKLVNGHDWIWSVYTNWYSKKFVYLVSCYQITLNTLYSVGEDLQVMPKLAPNAVLRDTVNY